MNRCLEEGAQMFMLKPLKHSDVKRLRCQLMQCQGWSDSYLLSSKWIEKEAENCFAYEGWLGEFSDWYKV